MMVLLGITLALIALVVGSSFWAVARSPAHLRSLLSNREELQRLLDFLGQQQLENEALDVKPVFGSYAANIAAFERAHLDSLVRTRNALLIVALALLGGSYLVNSKLALIVLALLILPSVMALPASAKNNNATHTHTILLNLRKWQTEDPRGCAEFCAHTHPEFGPAHEVLLSDPAVV